MKCKTCGQIINKTNLDVLKEQNSKSIKDYLREFCNKDCPFSEDCPDNVCFMNLLEEWLLKKAK